MNTGETPAEKLDVMEKLMNYTIAHTPHSPELHQKLRNTLEKAKERLVKEN